jgi:membrane-bound lytic murein transglycosylase D
MVVNDKVLAWVDLFQKNSVYRKSFIGGYERYGLYEDMIHQVLRDEGLPQDLIFLAFLESTYKTNAYSRARAKGIWQFMTTTGRQYGLRIDRYVDERSHPEKSTRAAARYLKDLYATFNDWHLAMAAYNTGAGNILRGQRRSGKRDYWSIAKTRYMHRDTKNFVPAILALALMGKNPEKYGFTDIEHFEPLEYDRITVEGPARLSLIASLADVPVEEIRALNPHLRRDVTPPGPGSAPGSGAYEVFVPRGRGDQVAEAYASLPRAEKIAKLDTEHTVRQGETLASIAARYGVSVNELARANGIRNPRHLRAGARLVVPHGDSTGSYGRETRSVRQDLDDSAPYHVVRRGETLSAISRAYGVSLGRLYSWNSMNARTILKPGMKIRVSPAAEAAASQPVQTAQGKLFHRVRPGDNLFQIARRYGTTVSNIKAWNKIDGDTIRTGETLTIFSD